MSYKETLRLAKIIENVGYEQILMDHMLTIEDVMIHLHDFGLIDLDPYEREEDE
jgi:hypothetical protein